MSRNNKKFFGSFTRLQPGPGNCLGLLAGKSGPTAVRGQYYGIAAAIGKVGAFVGTWGALCDIDEVILIFITLSAAFPPMITGMHFQPSNPKG
jgi:hypothetical protein